MKILLFCQGLDEFTPKAPELDEKHSLLPLLVKYLFAVAPIFFLSPRALYIKMCVCFSIYIY